LKAKVGSRLTINAAAPAKTTPFSQGDAKNECSNCRPKTSGMMASPPPAGAGTPTK
jgi:hypothetical protein